MTLIQDEIVVTKPTRVYVGTDRNTDEVRRAVTVDELVAQWWVPEGAELVGEYALPPWIEHGVRTQGWRLVRKTAAHTTPDLDAPVTGVRWSQVAEQMYDALKEGEGEQARDLYVTAQMQEQMLRDHAAEDRHDFGPEPNPTTLCRFAGCSVTYADRPTAEDPEAEQRPDPEWVEDETDEEASDDGL